MERYANNIRSGKEIIADARAEGHEVIIGNQDLPIAAYLPEIRESLKDNVFTILVSETGSGKTTQTPQVAFEMGMTVGHTQPRRSAAHEVALRIQDELSQAIPNLPAGTVAVHTAEESTIMVDTQITIMTDGMMLAVEYNPTNNALETPKDNHLTIVDEVHEGNKNVEVLLGLLMQASRTNPDLRVVITTATPNLELLTGRIKEITDITPNVIEVPGRTYPVEYIERPDLTSVTAVLEFARPGVGMMVFKPGIGEIRDTIHEISQKLPENLRKKAHFFIYHSTMSSQSLSEACNFEQGEDEIKIVVGTNAMESSLTIHGIHIVIDDATSRQVHTDKRGYEALYLTPISQDSIWQRIGRAGRQRPGIGISVRPDDKTPYIPFDQRPKHTTAEIHRRDLKNEVLELAAIGIDIENLPLINEAHEGEISLRMRIIKAKESLAILGALDERGRITEIGLEMNRFPVRATLKRAIVEGMNYDEDTQIMLAAMAAAVEAGGLPLYGRFASNHWKELSSESSSDLLRQLDLFIEVRSMQKHEQNAIGINPKNVARAEETYQKILHQLGLKDGHIVHPNEIQREEMMKCIYAGYVEYIFERMGRNSFRLLQDSEPTEYKLSDRSVVDPRQPRMVVGVPYGIERYRRGKLERVKIIEAVTVVPALNVLGEAAVNMAKWHELEPVWRGGRAFFVSEQSIRGKRTGVVNERMSNEQDVTIRSRELVRHVLEHPGPAQLRLRNIKKKLELLNHKAKDAVTLMTQESLLEYINLAVSRVSVLDAHHVDIELDLIMEECDIKERGVYVYVSEQEEARILADAPEEIVVDNEVFYLTYKQGHVEVHGWKPEQLRHIKNDIYLPDGRRVRFSYDKSELTVTELREALGF